MEELFKTMGLWLLWSPGTDDDPISKTATFLTKRRENRASNRVTIQVPPQLAQALGVLGKHGLALALLAKHPDWSVAKIAETVGCDRKTPYKWPRFRQALNALKSGRESLPRGEKSKSGDLEAWKEW